VQQKVRRPRRTGERYVAWRALCLRNAGFEPSEASRMACNTDFDLHALLELVDRGCRPDLAIRILAPLDWEPAP
jgi:hypothetical protein